MIRFVARRPESQDQALSDTRVKDRKEEKESKGRGEIKYVLMQPKHSEKASMINRSKMNTEEELSRLTRVSQTGFLGSRAAKVPQPE